MNTKVLGVLGGMGPLASAHFMLRLTLLTPGERDADHIPAVLWSDPTIPGRPEFLEGRGPDPLPALLRGIQGLRQAGCGAIVIPCNTAHYWYQPMLDAAGVPIFHIVDAAAEDLRAAGIKPGPIGLMSTAATQRLHIYQDRLSSLGWDCLVPDADEMAGKIAPAIAAVKANQVGRAYEPLRQVVNGLAARGAQAVVLGCTEIPLGILAGPADGLQAPVIDTVDSLARAAIRWAKGPPAA
ncbi:MAG TPA: amino acid racemase [Rhodopila sp.]|uniref:aspartate/glutamate racemase family protein n=1 Tax=Rhodopila sp. TaxID=2480087 RepID=UPI002C7D3E04|nr:amino acid racemase [Rhodopila sp.]HVY14726.1 amino acid racemase [Rhodopila sp.]